MANVNYSIPEEVKNEFNKTFAGKNKSQIIADLMLQAIEEQKRQQQRTKVVESILQLRGDQETISLEQIMTTRRDLLR